MAIFDHILKLFNRGTLATTQGERNAMQTHCPPGWRWVTTKDRWGRMLDEGWEYESPPIIVETNGLDHLPAYIDRLLATKNWFATLSAFTVDDEDSRGVGLWHQEGQVTINEFFTGPGVSDEEKRAKSLAAELGLSVHEEYRANDSTLVISWNLPSEPEKVFEVAKRFATEVRNIPRDAGMQISLSEPEDQRDQHQNHCQITISSVFPIEDPTAPPPVAK